MLLSVIDITMTFYQFFIVKKINLFGFVAELNPIFSRIINNNPTPIKYIICTLIAQSLFIIAIYFSQYDKLVIGIFIGILSCVIRFHFRNISEIKKYKRKL